MKINLDKFVISKKSRPLLIAEISCNHCGSLKLAKRIIKEAKKQGADFVKFQTYEPKNMTLKSNKRIFKIDKGLWKGKKLWDLYNKAKTPFSWQKDLFQYARKIKIPAFSTPYDVSAVNLLEKLNCPIYKVATFEVTDIPLIARISETKKPIILSTGMASLKEIDEAIKVIKKTKNNKFVILYCVTNYPARFRDFHLNNIKILQKKYNCFVGLSDHSKDNAIASLAVGMGAKIFEKHVALKNQKKSFDIAFSLKGDEIGDFSKTIKYAWNSISNENFKISSSQNLMKKYRRSIFITKNVKKNEIVTDENIAILRPNGKGIQPKYLKSVLGKKFKSNLPFGTALKWKNIKSF